MKGRICSVVNFKFPQLPGTNSSAHFVTVAVEDHTMIQCGSGIIFSGSSYEFLEFWTRILSYTQVIWKLFLKNTLYSTKRSIYHLTAISI